MVNHQFSIIVPFYNASEYIEKCIHSLLRQGLDDYEILLVNDGSTDKSSEICQKLKADHPCLQLISQSNQGVCAARNNGMAHAKGEWIVFVDADDYLLENGLRTAFDAAGNEDECDVIQYKSSYDFWPKRDLTSEILFKGSGHEFLRESGFVSFCWLCFYRRDFLQKNNIRFDNKYIVGEDQLFVANVFLHNPRTVAVSTDLYRYVVHENSATTKRDVMHTRRCVEDYLSSYYDIWNKTEQLTNSGEANVVQSCHKALNAKKMFGFSRMLSSKYGYREFNTVSERAKVCHFLPVLPNDDGIKAKMTAYMMNLAIQNFLVYKLCSWIFRSIISGFILPRLRTNLKNG